MPGTQRSPYSKTAAAYAREDVLTVSPVGLVVRVLSGAIVALERARRALATTDGITHLREVGRARSLIGELLGALDREQGGEIAGKLEALYGFMLGRLLLPRPSKKAENLEDAIGILRNVKEGFDAIAVSEG